jgi:hypothetical protein
MHRTLDADTSTRARVNLTEKQHASGYTGATRGLHELVISKQKARKTGLSA